MVSCIEERDGFTFKHMGLAIPHARGWLSPPSPRRPIHQVSISGECRWLPPKKRWPYRSIHRSGVYKSTEFRSDSHACKLLFPTYHRHYDGICTYVTRTYCMFDPKHACMHDGVSHANIPTAMLKHSPFMPLFASPIGYVDA
jgi:hypothetical protein